MLDRLLAVIGGLLGLATFVWGIFTWQDANRRPFFERQMAIYEAASKKAAEAALEPANETKKTEFMAQYNGPLKTVADRRVVLAGALMFDSLNTKLVQTKECDPKIISRLLADCMRESTERGWGFSLRDFEDQNYCKPVIFNKQLEACGTNAKDAEAMSKLFLAP